MQYVSSNDCRIVVDDGKIRDVWQRYYNQLLNEEFELDKNSLEVVESVQRLKTTEKKKKVVTLMYKMKSRKAAGSTGIVAEMLVVGEVGVRIVMKFTKCRVPDD